MKELETQEIRRLTGRIELERQARLEAEAIAERRMRDLYEKHREVSLLEAIAGAANEATTADKAIRCAMMRICEYTGWPLGQVYHIDASGRGGAELIPGEVWHTQDPTR